MYQEFLLILGILLSYTKAYPWVPNVLATDSSSLEARAAVEQRGTQTCPNNPNHPGAVPISSQYPYLGALNGVPGTGNGGIQVPMPGDTAHGFEAPGLLDIRGPCPGLNTAANHHFISHDGITTYNELVDMGQNVYNMGFDLSTLLAVLGVALSGDIISGKLSIGCDATSRTSSSGGVLGDEGGLDTHNRIEADSSLTRNDYFLADGDNYSMNATLFGMMADTCNNNFDGSSLSLYRYQRYQQSKQENGQFFFGPGGLLLYAAASFVYESFTSNNGNPDLATMQSFFGASQTGDGTYSFNGQETFPDTWFNRAEPYDVLGLGVEIVSMYAENPVEFGGNVGQGNFNGINYKDYIVDGKLNSSTGQDVMCLIYQLYTGGLPTSLSSVYLLPAEALTIVLKMLSPGYANLGCPIPLYSGNGPS